METSLCLFSTLRPFVKEKQHLERQEAALYSWSRTGVFQTVIIGADDAHGQEAAQRYNFEIDNDVRRAYDIGYWSQAPIITDLIELALVRASANWLALINSDIILMPTFRSELESLLSHVDLSLHPDPFITVRRRDFSLSAPLTTEKDLWQLASSPSALHDLTGSDIFITTKKGWQKTVSLLPPYIYGKFSWDVHLHSIALHFSSLPVDASHSIASYHPMHASIVDHSNPEVMYNLTLYRATVFDDRYSLADPLWLRM